tara:strand:+ start:373 stop:699 length:327 start_codon:yes stop_codon:yes gene_type:complete
MKYQEMKENFSDIKILNARDNMELVKELKMLNYNIDDGMILKIDDKIYFGDEVINFLAKNGKNKNFVSSLTNILFKSYLISKILYPIFKYFRFLYFKIFLKKFINDNS